MLRRIALHRWARFSLRGLALVVLLASVWIGREVSVLRAEREATRKLQSRLHMFFDTGVPTNRLWLRKWLGAEYLTVPVSMRHVHGGSLVTADDVEPIEYLTSLESLDLAGVDFDTIGLSGFRFPPTIKHARLNGIKMENWSGLQGLQQLDLLDLHGSNLDDDDLVHLSAMHKLRVLVLTGTQVSDNGMHQLTKLRGLQYLDLTDTAVSSQGLKLVGKLPSLKGVSTKEISLDVELERLYATPRTLAEQPGFPPRGLAWTRK